MYCTISCTYSDTLVVMSGNTTPDEMMIIEMMVIMMMVL